MKVDYTKSRFQADGTRLGVSEDVDTVTTNFKKALSAADDTVQKALETLDVVGYLYPDDAESLAGKALTVSGTTLYEGRLSNGNVNYKAGDPAGTNVSYIIRDATFTFNSPDQATTFNKADEGVLNYNLNSVLQDSVDLAANFVEAERDTDQTTVPWTGGAGDLSVTAVGWYNGFPAWQKGVAEGYVVPGDLQQGYNAIELEHASITTPQTSATLDVFYDNHLGADPSVGTPTVLENTAVIRYLSGIQFYDRGSTFNASVVGSNLFDNVYHTTSPLTYASTNSTMWSGIITHTDASVSGVSNPPVIGETMTVSNKVVTVPNSNVRSVDARISITPRDPYGSYTTVQSASENRMIDGYVNTSDALQEFFDSETYRMPAGSYDAIPGITTNQWTSSALLTNGNAQVFDGELVYPTINFTSGYLPSQNPSANYSTFTGDQVYYRTVEDTGSTPHNSGQLEFGGLVGSDIGQVGSGNVNVEIKLPTQTGWLDLGKPFDAGTFTGADGDGCRVTQSGDDWNWSCGTFSTANSGYMIVVRVTLRNSTKSITQMRELGW